MPNTTHVIALKTYGTERKRGKSALKISYSNAVAKVMLALIPHAQNISSNRDRYVYIHIPKRPNLSNGWLYITVEDKQLSTIETMLMSHTSSTGVVRWTNERWMLFPCRDNPAYHAPVSPYSQPKDNPHGYAKIDATSQVGQHAEDQIIAEYSKLYPDKPAWWWIAGNDATYKNLQALKRAGCRWKRRRGAFSYIGDELPESLLALLDNAEECRAIMGGMTPEDAKQVALNQPSSSSELTSIEILINRMLRDQIKVVTQDSKFPVLVTQQDIVVGQDILGLDRSQRIWYVSGNVQHAERQLIQATEADWSKLTRRWLFKTQEEIASLDAFLATLTVNGRVAVATANADSDTNDPCSLEEAKAVLGIGTATKPTRNTRQVTAVKATCSCEDHDGPVGWIPAKTLGTWIACGLCNPNGTNMPQANADDPDADQPPAVRIIQAVKLTEDGGQEDGISSAIRTVSKLPAITQTTSTAVVQSHKYQIIAQEPVGELTGSVIANVYSYGYALNAGKLVYLNMGGPRSGVEAIRGKLAQGKAINLIPDDAPAIELTAGEGMTGKYTAFISNLSEARFVSMILVHEDWRSPNYNGQSTTYILQVSEEQAKGQLLHHIRELVSVPVFADWTDYLWQVGQSAMLIRNCKAGGGITLKAISLDATAWKRLIIGGVANDIIQMPKPHKML